MKYVDQKYPGQEPKYWAIFGQECGQFTVGHIPCTNQSIIWKYSLCSIW